MLRRGLIPFFLSCSLAFTGCEGCDPEPDPGEGEGEGEDGPSEDAIAICEAWFRGSLVFQTSILSAFLAPVRCAASDLAFVDGAQFQDVAEDACAAGAAQEFQVGIDGGRVTFNRAGIEACAALDVANATELPAECEESNLYVSNLDEGDECVQDWDCPTPLECEAPVLTNDRHECMQPAIAGEDCLNGVRNCGEGLACVNFECVALAGVGDQCESVDECQAGLRCDPTLGTCQELIGAGGACEFDEDCAEGTVCFNLQCTAPVAEGQPCLVDGPPCANSCSVCRPSTPNGALQCLDRGEVGAGCASDLDCHAGFLCDEGTGACVLGGQTGDACQSAEDCRAGFGCGSNLTCVAIGALGGACDVEAGCADGAFCVDGTCEAGAAGDPCGSDFDCASPNLCAAATNTCGPAPTAGACSLDGGCGDGFFCDPASTTCVALPGAGDPCATDQELCAGGLFCGEGVCTALKPTGAACVGDEECLNGTCVEGQCSTFGMSCTTDKGFFQFFILLSFMLPLSRRALRRIRR